MIDVVLNKKESIERCVAQARRFHAQTGSPPFAEDHLRQDAVALNVQRAMEQAIDLANLVVRRRKLGLPKESAAGFALLAGAGIIPAGLAERLRKMVGFRNVLVHDYQEVPPAALEDVVLHHLDDLIELSAAVVAAVSVEAAGPSGPGPAEGA